VHDVHDHQHNDNGEGETQCKLDVVFLHHITPASQ
jgi:hypothetical protein